MYSSRRRESVSSILELLSSFSRSPATTFAGALFTNFSLASLLCERATSCSAREISRRRRSISPRRISSERRTSTTTSPAGNEVRLAESEASTVLPLVFQSGVELGEALRREQRLFSHYACHLLRREGHDGMQELQDTVENLAQDAGCCGRGGCLCYLY